MPSRCPWLSARDLLIPSAARLRTPSGTADQKALLARCLKLLGGELMGSRRMACVQARCGGSRSTETAAAGGLPGPENDGAARPQRVLEAVGGPETRTVPTRTAAP